MNSLQLFVLFKNLSPKSWRQRATWKRCHLTCAFGEGLIKDDKLCHNAYFTDEWLKEMRKDRF